MYVNENMEYYLGRQKNELIGTVSSYPIRFKLERKGKIPVSDFERRLKPEQNTDDISLTAVF